MCLSRCISCFRCFIEPTDERTCLKLVSRTHVRPTPQRPTLRTTIRHCERSYERMNERTHEQTNIVWTMNTNSERDSNNTTTNQRNEKANERTNERKSERTNERTNATNEFIHSLLPSFLTVVHSFIHSSVTCLRRAGCVWLAGWKWALELHLQTRIQRFTTFRFILKRRILLVDIFLQCSVDGQHSTCRWGVEHEEIFGIGNVKTWCFIRHEITCYNE